MTQPKLYFQGFEGARKVQSMMIDFPELRFVILSTHLINPEFMPITGISLKLYAPSEIELTLLGCSPINYNIDVHVVWSKTKTSKTAPLILIDQNDTETKIFVAPESEGFFEPKIDDVITLHECGSLYSSIDNLWLQDSDYDEEDRTEAVDRMKEHLNKGNVVLWKRNGKRIWMPQTL